MATFKARQKRGQVLPCHN